MSSNELYIAGRKVEIPQDQVVALTKQINDIATLAAKSNLSNTFTVPYFSENERNLSFVGRPGNNSEYPYRFLPARFIQNGIEIVRNGNAIITQAGEKQANVTLYWGNSDFFDRINFLLSELDTSQVDHPFTLAAAAELFDETDGAAFYPFIFTGDDNLTNPVGAIDLNIEKTPPAVTFAYLFDRIFEKIGFTYTGEIFNSDFFNTLSLQLTQRRALIPNIEDRKVIAAFNDFGQLVPFQFTPIKNFDNSFDPPNQYTNQTGVRARFTFAVRWDSKYETPNPLAMGERVIFEVLKNDELIFNYSEVAGWFTPRNFQFTADLSPGDNIKMQYRFEEFANPAIFSMGTGSRFETIDIEKEALEINDTYFVNINLPEITAQELLLQFARLTGTIFNVTEDRMVEFITINDIIRTKTERYQLPAALIPGTLSTTFNPGRYARNNIISYNQGDTDRTANERVDNKLLPVRLDFLQFDFYLARPELIGGTQTITVDLFDEEGELQDILSPIFNYERRALSADTRYSDNATNTEVADTVTFARVSDVQPGAILSRFYTVLFGVVQDFKRYTAQVMINEQQFFALKNYQAYYVNELMTYVYIERIENFTPGQPTKITMIKI